MLDGSLFDPHSTLRFLLVRYVHACGGVCFGQVVRSFFFHSGEHRPRVDCFFPTSESADQFLEVLAVEHEAPLVPKQKFGTNSYRVSRSTAHGAACSVELNVVSYYQGLTRRGRLPRNIPAPLFDIDSVFWEKGTLLSTIPKCFTPQREGVASLSHVLERCMQRKFACANTLCRRRPEALLFMLRSAKAMIEAGFAMDDACKLRMPVVLKGALSGTVCPMQKTELSPESVAVRLPCAHIISFDGTLALVAGSTSADKVCCPACNAPFCVKDPTAEGLL